MKDNKHGIKLRRTIPADLDDLFRFQLEMQADDLAAVAEKRLVDKTAFLAKYTSLLSDPAVNSQTIIMDNNIVGSIAKFERENEAEVTYLIQRRLWGKGVATTALRQFLAIETARPIFGRTAFDNIGSQKVLENCGFVLIGTGKYFAKARQWEIEEFIYKLDNPTTG